MASMAGIWNHPVSAGMPNRIAPMSSSPTGDTDGNAGSDSASISANDFLTLLVTEMQNQDPTADTDPNEYINQLVSVNSLEQLININQTLTTAMGPSSQAAPGAGTNGAAQPPAADTPSPSVVSTERRIESPSEEQVRGTPGNLSVPSASRAAERVAQSLGGH